MCFTATRGCGDSRFWMDEEPLSTLFLGDCVASSCRNHSGTVSQDNRYCTKTTPHLFVAVDVTVFDSRMIPLTGYTMRRSRVFCLPGKESWTVHAIISAIDAGGARVIAFHEANEDGSKFLDLFSNLTLRSGICFTLESIAFHEFLSNGTGCARASGRQRTFQAYRPEQAARDRCERHRAWETEHGIEGKRSVPVQDMGRTVKQASAYHVTALVRGIEVPVRRHLTTVKCHCCDERTAALRKKSNRASES